MNTSRKLLTLAIVGMVCAPLSAATMSDIAFRVDVQSELGRGSWEVDASQGVWDEDTYTWTLESDIEIMSEGGDLLATLAGESTSLFLVADPVVSLNFAASAGAAPANIVVTSGVLGFAPIANAKGHASAGISITDRNGDGVTRTGTLAGATESYRAHYNGAIPGGTLFANLVDNDSAGAFGTSTTDESSPGSGFTPLGSVSSMQTEFSFTLSAFDSATGTSVFVVIPEPTTILQCVLLAGMLVVRRRNRV